MEFQPINVTKWIEKNKADFLPPVCNKLMHNDQLKVMFVGGPNQRKDYHIEEGEELFYQLEGDMCLKIIENGEHRDIHIREGEMFLLPARIPHSPQRFSNTVGLVLERRRLKTETDGLRFFNSKQYKTGKPDPDWTPQLPFPLSTVKVMKPFSFQSWLDKHRSEIIQKKYLKLFAGDHETEAAMYGSGENKHDASDTDAWIWQLEGSSVIFLGDKVVPLSNGDSLLVPEKTQFFWKREEGCIAFCVCQDPARSKEYN
ncbi:3-hydroxyanthranilate 3,4-dioxygenase isoform X2 [Aquarana catesbeiana]|uniref:3-hydroxyanthranilate 3,4-dioxygenase isoform X2 n=1 Tax=Aquarana catesbeiana TaxID=8400 RepID=UPI003CCA2A61